MFHLMKLYNICVFSEFDTVTSVSVIRRVKTKMFPVSATLIEFQGHSGFGKTSKNMFSVIKFSFVSTGLNPSQHMWWFDLQLCISVNCPICVL